MYEGVDARARLEPQSGAVGGAEACLTDEEVMGRGVGRKGNNIELQSCRESVL